MVETRERGGVIVDRELPVSAWEEWKIVEKIGEGSFGRVYKAQRTEKGRSFYSAIKIITIPANKSELNSVQSETGDEKSLRQYFEGLVEECIQEVSTMEYFRGNSHIVSVEDFKVVEYLDDIGWEISIRMEYLESFMNWCASRQLTEKEVLKLGIDLSHALEYCEQLHIIHRDVKPENIFVSRFGDFKLGDFGIARELERSMGSMSKKGTYSYMAPEMYRGEKYDNRVDIYSLGLVLYKLMNQNRLPFLNLEKQLITYRDKENALARRMSGEKPAHPVNAGEAFGRMICKACAYKPEDRYQKPEDFRHDLENLYAGRTAGAFAEQPEQCADEQALSAARIAEQAAEERKLKEARQYLQDKHLSKEERLEKEVELADHLSESDKTTEEEEPYQSRQSVRSTRFGKRRRSLFPIILTVAAGVMVILLVGSVYIRYVLEEAVRKQSQEMVKTLEDSNYGLAPEQVDDFSEAIQAIKDKATAIVEGLEYYREEGSEGNILRYYADDGQLMKTLVYPSESEDNVYEEYYYWDEELFFAYIWEGENTEMYYYDEGKLIRWIDLEGVCHDNEIENSEYIERGTKYWDQAEELIS